MGVTSFLDTHTKGYYESVPAEFGRRPKTRDTGDHLILLYTSQADLSRRLIPPSGASSAAVVRRRRQHL